LEFRSRQLPIVFQIEARPQVIISQQAKQSPGTMKAAEAALAASGGANIVKSWRFENHLTIS